MALNDLEQCNESRRSLSLRQLSFLFSFVESTVVLDFRRSHGANNDSFRSTLIDFLKRHTVYRGRKNINSLSESLTKPVEKLLTYLCYGGKIFCLDDLTAYFRKHQYAVTAFERNRYQIKWDEKY